MKRMSAQVFACLIFITALSCSKKNAAVTPVGPPVVPPVVPVTSDVAFWLTRGDQTVKLQKQNIALNFSSSMNADPVIDIDESQVFQTIDGFGYTLTGGSATLINTMGATEKDALLKELFSNDDNAIGVNYLRISIGASDLSADTFTYNDLSSGATDVPQDKFSISKEMTDLVPILKKIIAINPAIKILGSPWTAPYG